MHHANGAEYGTANPAGKPHDLPRPVAYARNAVQRALDARAVVPAKKAYPLDHVLEVFLGDLHGAQVQFLLGEPCLRQTAEVEHNLQKGTQVRLLF